jgi:transposase
MGRQRQTYTAEFKREAVALLAQSGRSIADVSRQLAVHRNLLRRWQQELATASAPFPGRGHRPEDEIEQLRRERDRAREDLAIVKKALAYFAKERA